MTRNPGSPDLDNDIHRGYRSLARLALRGWPLIVFLVAVVVYGITLARTFTWSHDGADGGDLIAAAVCLGVPHPSGYPTYVLLARLFLRVLPLGEPAVRVHWLSALSAAAAVMLLGLSIAESLQPGRWSAEERKERKGKKPSALSASSADQGRGRRGEKERGSAPCPPVTLSPCLDSRWLTGVAAASAALILAFSPLLWSQATIAEVHALNVAFVAAVFRLLLRWRARGSPWLVVTAAFLYGLGLGNHLTGLLLLPAVIFWLLTYRRRTNLAGRAWLGGAGGFLMGWAVYVYLPLAAARQPLINWGDPRTWGRFWWLVTGQLYREAIFGVPLSLIPGRLSAWGHLLLEQFGWWGWALAFTGVWRLSRRDCAALGVSLFAFVAYSAYALGYDRADSYVYLLPACLMVAFWLGQGLATLLEAAWQWAQEAITPRASLVVSLLVAVSLIALLPLLPLVGNFAAHDLRHDREAADYAAAALAAAVPEALIVTSGDRATFALWYRHCALAERPDVTIVNGSLWGFDWYRRTLAAHHPAVALPGGEGTSPDLPELIQANLRQRSVYVTEEARQAVGDYRLEPAGPLYRLQPHEG